MILSVSVPFPKLALVFICLQYKSFETTVGKGEISSLRASFPLATVISNLLENFSTILIKFEIVVCKFFQFGRVYNLLFGLKVSLG